MNSYMLKPHLAKKFISEMEKEGLWHLEGARKTRNIHTIRSLQNLILRKPWEKGQE